MGQDAKSVLEPGEKMVWEGQIERLYLFVSLVISLLVTGVVSYYFNNAGTINYTSNGNPASVNGSTIATALLWAGVIGSALVLISGLVKKYYITNKRVVIKSGWIVTNMKSIVFTEIKAADLTVGLLDRVLSLGSVSIDTGRIDTEVQQVGSGSNNGNNYVSRTKTVYDYISHVKDSDTVYKHLHGSLSERQESLYSGRADRENQK